MNIAARLIIAIIALLHLYILWFEMFAWEIKGPKIFADLFAKDMFAKTKAMAANQGLYNGFLAAGLIWSLFIKNHQWQTYVATFFLCCILVAGVYGYFTVSKKILFVQVIPSIIALILVFI